MVKTGLFDEQAHRRITETVAQAEKKTSGEIVVIVARTSGSYGWVKFLFGAVGWLLASGLFLFLARQWDWPPSSLLLLEIQALGTCLLASLAFIPAVTRGFVPKEAMAANVHRETLANFCAAGLHETRDRTGILIYLSEFEHRVEILADRGIHEIAGMKYWEDQVAHIIAGIHAGRATEAMCEAISQIGEKLATHFPPREDDRNELGNEVRVGPQTLPKRDE